MLKGKRKVTILTERGEIPLIVDVDRRLWEGGVVDGQRVNLFIDPAYTCWKGMFQRAYKMQHVRPGYNDVVVCDEWFTFSNFDSWFQDNFVEGFVLDKDILVPSNKVYCPEFCRFVPSRINTLLSVSKRSKRAGLLGTHIRKSDGRISAKQSGDRGKHLGYFKTEEEAHFAWLKDKSNSIRTAAEEYLLAENSLIEIYSSLIERANEFDSFVENKIIYYA